MNRHPHAGGFAAYSEMLPQSAAVAFVLAEVAVNGAVMECYPVVFMQVGAYLFGTEFAADGAFVAVKLFGDFGDGAVAGQLLDVVSFVLGQLCVAHGNLSCRKGRMLPHTGLFLLWKVAFQMRIRRILKHERTKTPASLYTTKTFSRPTHKGKHYLPGTPLPSQPYHHLQRT